MDPRTHSASPNGGLSNSARCMAVCSFRLSAWSRRAAIWLFSKSMSSRRLSSRSLEASVLHDPSGNRHDQGQHESGKLDAMFRNPIHEPHTTSIQHPCSRWRCGMSGISLRTSVLAADDLVDYLVSVYPELADPGDMDIDFESYGKSVKESWVEFPLMFDNLIDRARHVETQYLKTSYMIERGVEYCCVSRPNSHGDIVSSMCAVVTKDDGSSIILDPDRPIIYGLIRANPQRPLSDLIGVQSYLVRVFSEFVGRPRLHRSPTRQARLRPSRADSPCPSGTGRSRRTRHRRHRQAHRTHQ